MKNQRDKFAAVFYEAYPDLSAEDQRLLTEMAQRWSGRQLENSPSFLLVGSVSLGGSLLDCAS